MEKSNYPQLDEGLDEKVIGFDGKTFTLRELRVTANEYTAKAPIEERKSIKEKFEQIFNCDKEKIPDELLKEVYGDNIKTKEIWKPVPLYKKEKDGVITIEESKTSQTELNVVEGMQFDKGYVSPYMVTDTEKMEAVVDNPYILITDRKISNIQEILPLLENLMQSSGKLVIVCDDIESEALSTLILNKLKYKKKIQ